MKVQTTDGVIHSHPRGESRASTVPAGVLTIEEYGRSMSPRYVQYSMLNVIRWWEDDS